MDDFTMLPKGINRLTQNARKALNEGADIAKKYGYDKYDVIHLFYALLTNKNNVIYEVLNKLGVDLDATLSQITAEFEKNKEFVIVNSLSLELDFTDLLKEIINESFVIAHDLSHVYVGTEHILFAMFNSEKIDFIQEIKLLGVDYNMVKNAILTTVNYPGSVQSPKNGQGAMGFEQNVSSQNIFFRNMNEIALSGQYSKITGRDKEISRLIHILSRKTKNNPILVGDAGVGKTAIVEGFVNRMIEKKVPASFINKKVINLDVASILSGARLRGDIEERVSNIINEVLEDGNSIIFIDEIHMIVGAGATGGRDSLDIANILKPYLTGSSLSVIGATTVDEYSKYFETDSALARRFQPIFVDELNQESAKEVIYGLIPEFERYHGVKIARESVDESVELSAKFIRDRYLPDKAIDVLDEAAASLKIGREVAMEPELTRLGNSLINIQSKKENALSKNDYKNASKFKENEEDIINEIEDIIDGRKKVKKRVFKTVTPELIQSIVVESTKIPIAGAKITDKRLKGLEAALKAKIIGQDRVINNVSLAIQKSHLGLSESDKPLASFLFLGPTGVGKTELAKSLARELFGSEDLLIQINMSELMEMHSVSKLIGSPPGYVGFQEGGQLTNFVKRRPYSVVLFDEIEKAHPDTLNILLQILEDGEVTDGKGMKVSLRNSIIVMTSNIGAAEVSTDNKLGFDTSLEGEDKDGVEEAYESMRNTITEVLRNTLRPELLNRIDLIDIFRGLNKQDCLAISEIWVKELILRLIARGIVLEVSKDVVNKINEEGYSKEYGARNIRRKVQELLENNLTRFLLDSNIGRKKNELIKLGVGLDSKGEIKFIK